MSSTHVEQAGESGPAIDNILESIPRGYRQAWDRMTQAQRAEACDAIFINLDYDKKQVQRSVLVEISKHRGWRSGMQFKEIARNLSASDKGQACFEVATAHQMSDNFYSTAICQWLLVNHLPAIGLYLDKAGIPNQTGSMNSIKWPNKGSGRYSWDTDTKSVDKVRIWYQAALVTACPLGLA